MKGFLVWPDGHRQSTEHVGGIHVIYPAPNAKGRIIEHTFTVCEVETIQEDVFLYKWESARDVNASFREGEARRRREEGRGIFPPELHAMHRGETSEEFERRIKIRTGELP